MCVVHCLRGRRLSSVHRVSFVDYMYERQSWVHIQENVLNAQLGSVIC
jgi:hypothetical protein